MDFYVYAHYKGNSDSLTDTFYVGKGKNDRAFVKSGKSKYWKGVVKKYGYNVKILHEHLTEQDALAIEKLLIAIYKGFGIKLANLTEGGDNPPSQLGKKRSEETRKKLSESHKGNASSWKGKRASEETRKKLSESHMEISPSKETRKKLSEALKGRKRSEETLKKIKETKLAKKLLSLESNI